MLSKSEGEASARSRCRSGSQCVAGSDWQRASGCRGSLGGRFVDRGSQVAARWDRSWVAVATGSSQLAVDRLEVKEQGLATGANEGCGRGAASGWPEVPKVPEGPEGPPNSRCHWPPAPFSSLHPSSTLSWIKLCEPVVLVLWPLAPLAFQSTNSSRASSCSMPFALMHRPA